MKNTRRTLSAATGCLVLLLLAGCAGLFPKATTQEALEDRVNGYMQAHVDGKWNIAYSFLDASSRSQISKENYILKTRKAAYKSFAVEEITVLPSEDQATVKVRIDISFMGYELKGTPHTQTWVKENGAWFVSSQQKATPLGAPAEKKE